MPEPVGGVGHLDAPVAGILLRHGVLECHGWALWKGCAPTSVEVLIDGIPAGPARVAVGRPDLLLRGGEAGVCGFELVAALPASCREQAEVTAVASFRGEHVLRLGPVSVRVELEAPRLERDPALVTTPAQEQSASEVAARPRGQRVRPHVLVLTHRLDVGGGQLYLQDLLRGLQQRGDLRLTVISLSDGPLRAELEALGIEVHVSGPWSWESAAIHDARVQELTSWARERGVAAMLVNTVGAFAGIEVAAKLEVPSVWAVHESYEIPVLWHAHLGPYCSASVRARAQHTLHQASVLVFEAQATMRLYAAHVGRERCRVIPYGIELEALERNIAGVDRHDARRRLGIAPQARMALCMGTVEPRKSQSLLVEAFRAVADRHPDWDLALVGDTGDEWSRRLRAQIAESGVERRVRLVPVTPEPLPWYRAADVMISASDVESLPRSALEAMACGLPVLAANVFGLPELIEPGVNGWLFAPRRRDALEEALQTVFSLAPAELARHGAAAATRVHQAHDASGYVAAYADLLLSLTGATQGHGRRPRLVSGDSR